MISRGLFGHVDQIAFVVPDVDKAVERWVRLFGAGPFFIIPGIRFPNWTYFGKPQDLPVDIAVGQLGDLQIEFVRPHRNILSVYRHAMGETAIPHHLGLLVDNLADANALVADEPVVTTGNSTLGTPFTYNDTRASLGLMVELIQRGQDVMMMFDHVRMAAQGWDGRDPLRRMPGA